MENYFAYYKGYKKDNNKKDTNPFIVLAVLILITVTIILGLFAIIASLIRGKSFKEIFEIAPFAVIMTFICLILFVPSLIFYLYLRKWNKEKKNWKNARIYLDDGEEITILVKTDSINIYLKTWKIYKVLKEEIINIGIEDKIRLSFKQDKEYYILFNEEDFNMLNIHK